MRSPGFFNLLHPRITNKQALAEEITTKLRGTTVDYEDTIVHEWCQKYRWNTTLSETPVPKFYIETSLKKWGKIHTEVLSIQCTADDAKFLKYFIVEACSQTKLQTGLFVPTGIHLLEGKEALHHLLVEHQEFINSTTSFLLEGISREEMECSHTAKGSIREILLKGPGVHLIEPTHQTVHKGQWMLVIQNDSAPSLAQYIKDNTALIYKQKTDKDTKLLVY